MIRPFAIWHSAVPVTIGTPRPAEAEILASASAVRARFGVWPSYHRIMVPIDGAFVVIEPA